MQLPWIFYHGMASEAECELGAAASELADMHHPSTQQNATLTASQSQKTLENMTTECINDSIIIIK